MSATYTLTPMQRLCALAIAELTEADGRAPTYAEIAAELDTNPGNVHALVAGLAERGWLTFRRYQPRSIRLLRVPEPLPEFDVEVTPAGRMAADEAARPDLIPERG